MPQMITRVRQWLVAVVAWVMRLRAVRAWQRYLTARGPLLAQGLSFQALFAAFAALWVGFAVAGFWVKGSPVLQESLLDIIASAAPGLIDRGDGKGGAVAAEDLLSAAILGWTGAIAAVGLAWTALGWLGSGREAVRNIFGLGGVRRNLVLQTLIDIACAVGFGVAVLISAVMSVLVSRGVEGLLGIFGATDTGLGARLLTGIIGYLTIFIFDTAVLIAFYRIVSAIPVPWPQLLSGAMVAAVGLGALKALGSLLLGGASQNPLLASFAVLIGLLIWFNLVNQVLLVGAAWIAESSADAHVRFDTAGLPSDQVAPKSRRRWPAPRVRASAQLR